MNRQEILTQTVNVLTTKFSSTDSAPKELLAVSNGMLKTQFLFDSKQAALSSLNEMSTDNEVNVNITGHGYIVEMQFITDDNLVKDIVSEASAIAISKVNPHVQLLDYADINGKANDMWFAEPM